MTGQLGHTQSQPAIWLQREAAPRLTSSQRTHFLRDKIFHENLVACLMAAAASFIEIKPHLPVFSIEGDDFTDAATVDRDGNSANIQVVSTSCDPRLVVSKESITELVIDRINSKHKKDQAYSAGSFLVVFVTQSDWTLDMRRVRESVSSNPLFCSYWVISPVNPASGCRFLVDNFWNTESGADESVQLVVDFTPPDTEVYINSLSDFTKYGRMYSLEAYLHK